MLTVQDSIAIQAPPEAVFGYLDRPAHQAEVTPHLAVSELVERLENGGSRARYVYEMLGLRFSGEVRATDYAPNQRIVFRMTGDLQGTIRWYLAPEGGGTRFTYAATYLVPGPAVLQRLATPLVRAFNAREVRAVLKNVRRAVEAQRSVA